MSRMQPVKLPNFGDAKVLPRIATAEYAQRIAAATERMQRGGLDFLAVYADREHFANMAFLTGFDPRFEESLMMMSKDGRRLLLVGNECLGYLPDEALGLQVALYQNFSLMGQPRDRSPSLRKVLADFGIGRGAAIGVAGWKYFEPAYMEDAEHAIESPAFLVDLLRNLAGGGAGVRNAGAVFMHPQDGLRIVNSADQIAMFEYAAVRTSRGVLDALKHIRPGVREMDLGKCLVWGDLPLSCHATIGFGEKCKRGLAGPSDRQAQLGDTFAVGFGIWGSLSCRAGIVGAGPQDLRAELREFYDPYVANYFDVVAEWYERIRVGATGGEVFDAVEGRRDGRLYRFAVNPGHYIHLDEWVHSPFARGSGVVLRSGMALQMDIIPVSSGPFCYTNAEDGVALADETLRQEIAQKYPAAWKRIQKRQKFMTGALGIRLDDSVLPLSNMPAWLPPYALNLDQAMVK